MIVAIGDSQQEGTRVPSTDECIEAFFLALMAKIARDGVAHQCDRPDAGEERKSKPSPDSERSFDPVVEERDGDDHYTITLCVPGAGTVSNDLRAYTAIVGLFSALIDYDYGILWTDIEAALDIAQAKVKKKAEEERDC